MTGTEPTATTAATTARRSRFAAMGSWRRARSVTMETPTTTTNATPPATLSDQSGAVMELLTVGNNVTMGIHKMGMAVVQHV